MSVNFVFKPDLFLVCGLGSLGQHSIATLKQFGVLVHAINDFYPQHWETDVLPDLFVEGDFRYQQVLEKAKIRQCRAVLLVSSNENINLDAAFAARLLNPDIRIVIRSNKLNLNQLLTTHLGNFVAFDPASLSADAFALSALGETTLGCFSLDGKLMRVVKETISWDSHWRDRTLVDFKNRYRRVIAHLRSDRLVKFHQWQPEEPVKPGDEVIYIETFLMSNEESSPTMPSSRSGFSIFSKYNWSFLKQGVQDFWFAEHRRLRRVAMVSSIAVAALLLLGTILFLWTYPNSSLRDAVNATIGLLLGGYPDVVGGVEADPQIPSWLLLFSLGLTVAGTAFVGVLYALLTERLLSARFQFTIKRPPVPAEDHVVLYGLGRTGRSIVTWLQKFGQPVVAIAPTGLAPEILPELPVVTGDMASCLEAANWSTARSMILATDDEMQNLELGLLAHTKNVEAGLVIRTFNQRFSDNLAQLLPYAHVLCAHALAAEAFAGAAFGENIAGLFRLYGETVLVTEYCVESGDTLHGLMLAQVAYGYEVMPLLHQNPGGQAKFLPSDDLQLAIGDRLVVLATTEGLRRIEKGERGQPTYGMVVDRAMTAEAVFEGANAIARIVGCDIGKARDFMVSLPVYLPHPLYFHQAKRLLRHLTRNRVDARVVPFAQIANGQLRQ